MSGYDEPTIKVKYTETLKDPSDFKEVKPGGDGYFTFGLFTKETTRYYFGNVRRHDDLRQAVESEIGHCHFVYGQMVVEDDKVKHIMFHSDPGQIDGDRLKHLTEIVTRINGEFLREEGVFCSIRGRLFSIYYPASGKFREV